MEVHSFFSDLDCSQLKGSPETYLNVEEVAPGPDKTNPVAIVSHLFVVNRPRSFILNTQ